jgi:hypothetical protein
VFATLGALDVFFYNLGWSKTDSWYYIVTEDEWVINKTGADGLSQPTFTLMPCDDECRDECISYSNPVFGVVGATEGTYENDVNSFLIDAALIDALDTAQLRFIIQKQVGSIWSDLGFLDDSLGEETDFGSVTSHPTYQGYAINWGKVLSRFGEGCYRVKVQTTFYDATEIIRETIFEDTAMSGGTAVEAVFASGAPVRIAYTTPQSIDQLLDDLKASEDFAAQGASMEITKGVSVIVTAVGRANNYLRSVRVFPEQEPEIVNGLEPQDLDYDSSSFSTQDAIYMYCMVSEPFKLKTWVCERAAETVKFETYSSGKVGDVIQDYVIHDLCGMNWYDSIRVKGFFGHEKVPEYRSVQLKWGSPKHGKIVPVRDEAVQTYLFRSDLMPKYVHDRLKVYGLMANEVLVSDYNLLNADFNVKRLGVVKDSGYEPNYHHKEGSRLSDVEVSFKRSVQGVIKSNCC